MSVICGPSGSGKSSLAFDTIYAEGGRRYIETFNPYTRQFLDRLKEPDADSIKNVRPALALEQRNRVTSSRSTVGSITEINDYLKILWSQLAEAYCEKCNSAVHRYSPEAVVDDLEKHYSFDSDSTTAIVTFEISRDKKIALTSIAEMLESQGFQRFILEEEPLKISRLEEISLLPSSTDTIQVVVDRIKIKSESNSISKSSRSRLISSLNQAYEFSKGSLKLYILDENSLISTKRYERSLTCRTCNKNFPTPSPSIFSFNSPIGACRECQGFGKTLQIDLRKCIPDPSRSIKNGAIACWEGPAASKERTALNTFCEEEGISLTASWESLPEEIRNTIFHGPEKLSSKGRSRKVFKGILPWFEHLQTKRHKMHVRVFIARYRSEFLCHVCNGSRLISDASAFRVEGKTIYEFWKLPAQSAQSFIKKIPVPKKTQVVKDEIVSRLSYLCEVGLPYLSLERQTRTLSGGEFQRVNLTTILGTNLVNTTQVLDEPTIGLHPRDTTHLIRAMRDLQQRGNTLVVVEHDPEVIQSADRIFEIGPSSGSQGGELVFEGSPASLTTKSTKTGLYLKALNTGFGLKVSKAISLEKNQKYIEIREASAHNLKNINVSIPYNMFSVLSGVSGSGKSSLINECLCVPVETSGISSDVQGEYSKITGLEHFHELVLVDQQPIGKTSRANPATYTKAWEVFREYLAETEASQTLGLSKSSFSFNVDGGRCPVCSGNGSVKIEMQFLTDVWIECEVCRGHRFQDQVLTVKLGQKNVYEWLTTEVGEVFSLIDSLPDEKKNAKIKKALQPLIDLGLSYLPLGHSLSALSGGEAQRLKLASFIGSGSSKPCLIVLDEPTTGLHPTDISLLLSCIRRLLERGHTVVTIEHNLDVIRSADWLIELGPEGGESGGHLLYQGLASDIVKNLKIKSPTLQYLREEGVSSNRTKGEGKNKKLPKANKNNYIEVIGAREHNLKNISVAIPTNTLSVVTGVSGSGKSTLAFDIIFSEGQRRFIDCLSPYARQYIKQGSRPEVDQVLGIPPTVAVSQKTAPPQGISTLGTVTEVYQYLRLMFSKVGEQRCVKDGEIVSDFSPDRLVDELLSRFKGKYIYLFAPVVSGRKGYYTEIFARAIKADINEARIDGSFRSFTDETRLERHKLHWISLLVGKIKVGKSSRDMLSLAVSQGLILSGGSLEASTDPHEEPEVFSTARVCPKCKTGYMPLDPQDFSFRSLRGLCKTCGGRGYVTGVNERNRKQCSECSGSRVGPIARNVEIFGKTIHDLSSFTAPELLQFFKDHTFPLRVQPIVEPLLNELMNVLTLIDEIGLGYLSLDRDASTLSGGEAQRLRLAKNLGAPLSGACYVLDEPSIGLHSQDHEQLMNTLRAIRDQGNTVLVVEHDEDTIREADFIVDIGPVGGSEGGNLVHAGDFDSLLKNQKSLTAQALIKRQTSQFNQDDLKVLSKEKKKAKNVKEAINLYGANTNNLKNVSVSIPRNGLTVVIGVSGAGKSSLVHGSLYPAIFEEFEGASERNKFADKTWDRVEGLDNLERMIEIDQNPIGKTPASTPASFLGVFNTIRDIFAELPEAKIRGFNASYFSYNRGKGRCSSCEGRGYITIPMSFMPDAKTLCETCYGLRYNEEALEVKLQEYSIGAILKLTIEQAYEVFTSYPRVRKSLEYALRLGIGYISLGQASHTLSGGEAQRLKIAKELGSREARNTLYILDEPTIGLHMLDVDKLLDVVKALVSQENSVVVIEHNLDVVLAADYIIELGPKAGDEGGELLFQGDLNTFLASKIDTPSLFQLKKYLKRNEQYADSHKEMKISNG